MSSPAFSCHLFGGPWNNRTVAAKPHDKIVVHSTLGQNSMVIEEDILGWYMYSGQTTLDGSLLFNFTPSGKDADRAAADNLVSP